MVRRRRQRRQSSPVMAWIVLLAIIFGVGYAVWKLTYTPTGDPKQTNIYTEEGVVPLIKMEESDDFNRISSIQEVWENESILSKNGGISLEFFNDSTVHLDKNTTLEMQKVRFNEKENASEIEVALTQGRVWINAEEERNPKSNFIIHTPNFTASTKGANFSLDEYSVVVIDGMVTISVGDLYTRDIDVGQELVFSEADVRNAQIDGSGPQKEAMSDIFRMSDWFAKNTKEKDIASANDDSGLESDISDQEALEIVGEAEEELIRIVTPGKNNSTVTVNELPSRITGNVPEGTQKVMINGFTLSKFLPGDSDFLFLADTKWNTLKEGKNEYIVVAVMEDSTRHESKIIIVYDKDAVVAESVSAEATPDKEEAVEEETESESAEATPEEEAEEVVEEDESEVTGVLSITSPKNGLVITASETVVSGTAPSNAASIVVNGYTLGKFEKGNPTWTYIIAQRLGNRPTGEYTVKVDAKNSAGEIISTKNITITLKGIAPAVKPEVDMREDTLPPVQSDDLSNPTI